MPDKRALITGITGQDGSYLAEFLLEKGYEVYGLVRRSSTINFERINHIQDDLHILSGDLLDQNSLTSALREARPIEVYNLAAQSFVQASFQQPLLTGEITGLGVARLLESLHSFDPELPMASPSSTDTGSRSTTARATICSAARGSCSTTNRRAEAWSS